jgi:predicted ATPase
MEKLYVKNFLGLDEMEIEVKDFLILIGPQAAGKSVCAKLLYFFRSIFPKILQYYSIITSEVDRNYCFLLDDFIDYFPIDYWMNTEFQIQYTVNDQIVSVVKQYNKELQIDISEYFIDKIKLSIQDRGATRFPNLLFYENIFIPAGRSFFSLLQKNIWSFLATNNTIDPFIKQFGVLFEKMKTVKKSATGELVSQINIISQSIIKGIFVPEYNDIILDDGRKVNLAVSSSGQQESVPLLSVLASVPFRHYQFGVNIYVEEPEAHLFPESQEAMIRLISLVQHNSINKVNFVITTHSPYIMSAFNNLIAAGNIAKQDAVKKQKVAEIIPENMQIDVEKFSAYSLENGKQQNIIEDETSLINANTIDSASDIIGEIYGKLLDIEFSDNNNIN